MKIEVKNVQKRFKKNIILDQVNVTFESGKIYGFVGRNGSGKTVLLKMICGFFTPTKGEILIDGVNIIKEKSFPKDTRALIENPKFIPDLSGLQNLKLLAKIQNKISEKEILETLEKVNLLKEKDKKFSEYSLGMKQKLGIAQVLMEDPKIIILDEPFNGIESETTKKLRDLLLEEKKRGKLILLATHIEEDLKTMVDELYEFNAGIVTKKSS